LATILMYARLLRQGRAGGDPAKADRFLGVIERESDRLQTMVRQMLQIARRETSEFQRSKAPVNLTDVFEQLLPTMADQATEKGLAFNQRVPDDLPRVTGDIDSLYLIFKNLLENAVKFTPAGVVRFEVTPLDNMVCLRIQDHGIGMPEEALSRIFNRFYRSQTAVERGIAGTGLGLYMVKEEVDWLNGTITVESEEGKGTTFTVCLPTYDRD
jgi:two-component system phosphate regulon sensor histidine kinase PhoR